MTATQTQRRSFASHKPMWQRFQTNVALASNKTSETTTTVYQRQYSHVYAHRLAPLKARCLKAVPPGIPVVDRLLDLEEDIEAIVVGTLTKEQGEKDPIGNSKCRPDDVLVLEDESGRVNLKTDMVHEYNTGVVIAVQGVVRSGGLLHVTAFHSPAPVPVRNIHGELQQSTSGLSPHVLIVSGLECGSSTSSSTAREMLLSYLDGTLTPSASKVCRVIVAGGCAYAGDPIFGSKEFDAFVAQVCAAGIPVDILPGKDDPTTANWPQRPLHSSLLKYTGTFRDQLVHKTPNPYASGLGDKYVLGTDGRNVTDLVQHILQKDETPFSELQALDKTLRWGHICPNGPDTVPTVPHAESDPMVISFSPNLYFAGNCSKFATDLVSHQATPTRLVCVPKFVDSGEAALVNLQTLGCELVRFNDDM